MMVMYLEMVDLQFQLREWRRAVEMWIHSLHEA